MRITNKQIRQIIKEELTKVVKETMISPSGELQDKIMNDPNVHPMIKSLLNTGDIENIKQAIELLKTVDPAYAQELENVELNTFAPGYEENFNQTSQEYKKKIWEEGLYEKYGEITRNLIHTKIPELKGTEAFFNYHDSRPNKLGYVVYSNNEEALQRFAQEIEQNYNVIDVEVSRTAPKIAGIYSHLAHFYFIIEPFQKEN